jgi:hypothetical protein
MSFMEINAIHEVLYNYKIKEETIITNMIVFYF